MNRFQRALLSSSSALVFFSSSASRAYTHCEDKLVLYQYKICPFCNRVKAYLDYLNVDYSTIEVDPLRKSEISFSSYKKVPILINNEKQYNDSDDIINLISSKYPKNKEFYANFEYWNEYSSKKLAIYLYPNITRNFQESLECFSYTSEIEAWSKPKQALIQYVGALFMLVANGKIKKKYSIVDERKELNDVLLEFTNQLNEKNKYLQGDTITLPDILVYGVLRSIDHTTTFREIMSNQKLRVWYGNVKAVVTR